MELTGLSPEHGVRPAKAGMQSTDCEGRAPRPGTARSGSLVSPASALVVDLSANDSPAVPGGADLLQADYFLRLLTQNRRLIEQRIDEYGKAITVSEAKGDAEGAAAFRRMTLSEEGDRQTVDGLIDRLRRRFPRKAAAQVTSSLQGQSAIR